MKIDKIDLFCGSCLLLLVLSCIFFVLKKHNCNSKVEEVVEEVVEEKVIRDTVIHRVEIVKDSLIPVKEIVYIDTTRFDTAAFVKSYFTQKEYHFQKADSNYCFDQWLTLYKNEITSNIFEIDVVSSYHYKEVLKYKNYKCQLFVGGELFVPFHSKPDISLHGGLMYKKHLFGIGYQFVNPGVKLSYGYNVWRR